MIKKESTITIGLALTLGGMIVYAVSTFATEDFVRRGNLDNMKLINATLEPMKEDIREGKEILKEILKYMRK